MIVPGFDVQSVGPADRTIKSQLAQVAVGKARQAGAPFLDIWNGAPGCDLLRFYGVAAARSLALRVAARVSTPFPSET
jgi:hypothetical protein